MGDQLDFSKLLLWKLLLSLSSLDDALDANYYANWDTTYGDARRGDSYLNTLIVMGNNSEEITNTILLSEDNKKKKKLTKELLDDNKNRALSANIQKQELLHKTLERQDTIKYKAHGGEGSYDDTAAINKNQATTQIQIKREKLKQKRDELQKLNSKSTAPGRKKSNLIADIKNLETEIKHLTPDDTDATRREENAKIAKLRRLEREQAHEAHKAEMSKLDDTHNAMVVASSHKDNREEMDAVHKHHAKDLHAKGKAHLAKAAHHAKAAQKKARNSNHGSGADFKKKQNESNNLIYLEQAIDDEANEPSASTVTFEGNEYKQYGHQEEFISSLEDRLNILNSPLVGIVNEFYDTIDPLTLTYLNKLIATSIPLIDRIKLYIFLASLMPEFGEALEVFMETMNPMWLNIYTTSLNHNMKGLFYKHGDVLETKRAKSILKSKERNQMLKNGIKKRAFGNEKVTKT